MEFDQELFQTPKNNFQDNKLEDESLQFRSRSST